MNDKPGGKTQKPSSDVLPLVERKIDFFKDVIQKTIIQVQKNKMLDILGISDVSNCIEKLGDISRKVEEVSSAKTGTTDHLINHLQVINNELSGLLKSYGTQDFEDLLLICFGNNSKITTNDQEQSKYDLLKRYFHPTSYKVLSKSESKKAEGEDKNLQCTEIATLYKQFHMKVYGIKICVHSVPLKKSLLVYGIVDDIVLEFLNSKYINDKIRLVKENVPKEPGFPAETFDKFLSSLMLKDFLIYDNYADIYSKFAGTSTQITVAKQKQISQVVKEFIADDMYNKRTVLIALLVRSSNYENQYLAYLLYDLLSNDSNGSVDTQEQITLFDSFPWNIKQSFKQAMKKTVQYTNELSHFDINKIPLEQQICLLKVSDTVKEKAMMKLKEVKAKAEDSGSKARQYLDGLLKIPFGICRKEPILHTMETVKARFQEMCKKHPSIVSDMFPLLAHKERHTSLEIIKSIGQYFQAHPHPHTHSHLSSQLVNLKQYLGSGDKKTMLLHLKSLEAILKKHQQPTKLKYSTLNKDDLVQLVGQVIDNCADHPAIVASIVETFNPPSQGKVLLHDMQTISASVKTVTDYMVEVKGTLDKAVHGHEKAKRQIERIIGQWINGEQTGYCFGFEGPPGTGKTSLAKRGLSNCLKDDKGESRPFAMIQMGGDSNGSTIHGHNYTYVGSTWGSIVQILIDKKCMNPIIFIDEVDKISRTEHGKEIVGILTHLLDPAQNDCFQDKYFTGIDLDLSKALFILSYNDVDAIDKILLDRVHRIKFANLSLEDKLIICKTHILPEVYRKMGLEDMIGFADDVLKFIIEEYTSESGVRKLKEVLFEIVGEINLDILQRCTVEFDLPIHITVTDIQTKYFKDKHEIRFKKIHAESRVGIINGLWANALGKGGVIPIQVSWRPHEQFLGLHLTGMQGDVMKESMNVALTLAWELTPDAQKQAVRAQYGVRDESNGVHVHCPEGATPKDGPSAGTAITTAIYSMLNERKIKYNIAITGEICLNGYVTEIGGLDLKILGAIKAGVKEILFPVENAKDHSTFMEKYGGTELLEGIRFHPVSTIHEVFDLVFE